MERIEKLRFYALTACDRIIDMDKRYQDVDELCGISPGTYLSYLSLTADAMADNADISDEEVGNLRKCQDCIVDYEVALDELKKGNPLLAHELFWQFERHAHQYNLGVKKATRDFIGRQIVEARSNYGGHGFSQRELAMRTGYDAANIARIELGRYSVGLDIIATIADELNLDVVLKDRKIL